MAYAQQSVTILVGLGVGEAIGSGQAWDKLTST